MTTCLTENCDAAVFCRGYCKKHYAKARRSGELQVDPRYAHAVLEERFWRKVRKTDRCWIWDAVVDSSGYGFLKGEGGKHAKNISAHRYSYTLHHGPIPDGLVVMHSCDNRRCVNPDHLSVGTHKDNTQDMISKGRAAKGNDRPRVGSDNGRALLTEDKVRYIRASTASHAALARELGVTDVCIFKVRAGQTWSHVK